MSENRNTPPWEDPEKAKARADWRSLGHHIAFENPWIRVESHDVVAPTGKPAHYGLVHFKNRAVGVIPLHNDGTISLVGQQRFPLGRFSWEIPEGGVPYDEDLLAGAKRELREETGFVADSLIRILELDLTNSVADEVCVLYLATGLRTAASEPDDTEALEYARVPFSHLLKAVIMGQVRDSLTVAGVLRLHHMLTSGELPSKVCEALLSAGE